MRRRYFTLDVFTTQRFAGNPLAVVLQSDGLETPAMQAIAREFNLPETVFVYPPDDPKHRARVRIFTPGRELPFAGHPDRRHRGAARASRRRRRRARDRACGTGRPGRLQGPAGPRRRACELRHSEIARASRPGAGPGQARRGAEPEARRHRRRRLRPGALERRQRFQLRAGEGSRSDRPRPGPTWAAGARRSARTTRRACFCFAARSRRRATRSTRGCSRRGLACIEDPATGSAAAAFAGPLAAAKPGDGQHAYAIEQGYEMGRPSLINLTLGIRGGALTGATVGGDAVLVGEGAIEA